MFLRAVVTNNRMKHRIPIKYRWNPALSILYGLQHLARIDESCNIIDRMGSMCASFLDGKRPSKGEILIYRDYQSRWNEVQYQAPSTED